MHVSKRIVVLGCVIAGLALAGCGGSSGGTLSSGSSPSSQPSNAGGSPVELATTNAGQVLVDAAGFTLYTLTADKTGSSSCSGSCASIWPPAAAPTGTLTPGQGVTGAVTSISRSDGTRQL